jgi:hypothetical protein
MVISLGGSVSSCWNFIQTVESTLAELGDDLNSTTGESGLATSGGSRERL